MIVYNILAPLNQSMENIPNLVIIKVNLLPLFERIKSISGQQEGTRQKKHRLVYLTVRTFQNSLKRIFKREGIF